jgi:hypothetical protein
MELRAPPETRPAAPRLRPLVFLQIAVLAALVPLYVFALRGPPTDDSAEQLRDVAGKLVAAGAVDEAAALYEQYLARGAGTSETRARVAFSVGKLYLERGRYEDALRWLYQAELGGAADVRDEVGRKIVYALERLGRVHAAQAALDSRSRLDAPVAPVAGDPVVAKIGQDEIHRSEVMRALDDMPPQMRAELTKDPKGFELLRRHVADELLWRKAQKLDYGNDDAFRRRLEAVHKQLVIGTFIEKEILGKVTVDPRDIESWYAANAAKWAGKDGKPRPFADVRAEVEQDYRQMKISDAYTRLVEQELQTTGVVLYPEKMAGGAK